jgi:hypothetical protein
MHIMRIYTDSYRYRLPVTTVYQVLPKILQRPYASEAVVVVRRCGHYRCERIPSDPNQPSPSPKYTIMLCKKLYLRSDICIYIYVFICIILRIPLILRFHTLYSDYDYVESYLDNIKNKIFIILCRQATIIWQ